MSEYWSVSEGTASRTGWACRECRKVIGKGEEIVIREGRKLRFTLHKQCFTGADPRSQSNSSVKEGKFAKESFQAQAPATKGYGKWSVSEYGYKPVSSQSDTKFVGSSKSLGGIGSLKSDDTTKK